MHEINYLKSYSTACMTHVIVHEWDWFKFKCESLSIVNINILYHLRHNFCSLNYVFVKQNNRFFCLRWYFIRCMTFCVIRLSRGKYDTMISIYRIKYVLIIIECGKCHLLKIKNYRGYRSDRLVFYLLFIYTNFYNHRCVSIFRNWSRINYLRLCATKRT